MWWLFQHILTQNFDLKRNCYFFSDLTHCGSVPHDLGILTKSPQISGQNKSEDREPEVLVKITYGIVANSLFLKEREIQIRKKI